MRSSTDIYANRGEGRVASVDGRLPLTSNGTANVTVRLPPTTGGALIPGEFMLGFGLFSVELPCRLSIL